MLTINQGKRPYIPLPLRELEIDPREVGLIRERVLRAQEIIKNDPLDVPEDCLEEPPGEQHGLHHKEVSHNRLSPPALDVHRLVVEILDFLVGLGVRGGGLLWVFRRSAGPSRIRTSLSRRRYSTA